MEHALRIQETVFYQETEFWKRMRILQLQSSFSHRSRPSRYRPRCYVCLRSGIIVRHCVMFTTDCGFQRRVSFHSDFERVNICRAEKQRVFVNGRVCVKESSCRKKKNPLYRFGESV